tara:strand:+ start:699 stop:839 length:141 start_codon:yes stop_codon:yes gene_type:complete
MSNTAAVEKEFSSDDSQHTIDESSFNLRNLALGTFESILFTCSLDI